MLVTTVGAYSANSYITLEEAEEILSNLGMRTDAWLTLTAGAYTRTTGTVTGPFVIIPGVSDTLLLSVVEGDEEDHLHQRYAEGEDKSRTLSLSPSGRA